MQTEIRTLTENDLAPADQLFRLAFGTFFGLPDPLAFRGDALLVSTRFRIEPAGIYGAFADEASAWPLPWVPLALWGPLFCTLAFGIRVLPNTSSRLL
jgi:hypothetical protein